MGRDGLLPGSGVHSLVFREREPSEESELRGQVLRHGSAPLSGLGVHVSVGGRAEALLAPLLHRRSVYRNLPRGVWQLLLLRHGRQGRARTGEARALDPAPCTGQLTVARAVFMNGANEYRSGGIFGSAA